jgi:energy-coupling factor transporter transmembrane protein EcfT
MSTDGRSTAARTEPRWPPALAVLVLIALPFLLPEHLTVGPSWLLPAIGFLFFVAIAAADPTRVARGVRMVRLLAIGLTVVFIAGGAVMTFELGDDLIHGGPVTQSANELLSTGALVWLNNNIIFGFLYWELDGGGPAARAHGTPVPDFGFPQQMNPEISPPGWRPVFVDYLYVGLTNATAFSPTDAMPLAQWAKLTMGLQAVISMVVLSLVIARAVNVLG